jgi:HAD superfamily hydrolase (TIGR01509 family)
LTTTNLADTPIDLVIFDCDGVLVDTERLAVSIDARVLADIGWPLSDAEIIERFVGRPDAHMLEEVEKHIGRDISSDWYGKYSELYRSTFETELEPVPGIVDALSEIDLPDCVASSGTHDRIRFTLGLTGLWDRFVGRIFSVEDVSRGKPWPDLFLHAADQMKVEPRRCAVVEDSAAGVEAARAAGMHVLAYAGGVTSASRLAGSGTVVFDNMEELPLLLPR